MTAAEGTARWHALRACPCHPLPRVGIPPCSTLSMGLSTLLPYKPLTGPGKRTLEPLETTQPSPWLLGRSLNPGGQLGPPLTLSGGRRLHFLDLHFSLLLRLHVSGLQDEARRARRGRSSPFLTLPSPSEEPRLPQTAQLYGRGLSGSRQCSVQLGHRLSLSVPSPHFSSWLHRSRPELAFDHSLGV